MSSDQEPTDTFTANFKTGIKNTSKFIQPNLSLATDALNLLQEKMLKIAKGLVDGSRAKNESNLTELTILNTVSDKFPSQLAFHAKCGAQRASLLYSSGFIKFKPPKLTETATKKKSPKRAGVSKQRSSKRKSAPKSKVRKSAPKSKVRKSAPKKQGRKPAPKRQVRKSAPKAKVGKSSAKSKKASGTKSPKKRGAPKLPVNVGKRVRQINFRPGIRKVLAKTCDDLTLSPDCTEHLHMIVMDVLQRMASSTSKAPEVTANTISDVLPSILPPSLVEHGKAEANRILMLKNTDMIRVAGLRRGRANKSNDSGEQQQPKKRSTKSAKSGTSRSSKRSSKPSPAKSRKRKKLPTSSTQATKPKRAKAAPKKQKKAKRAPRRNRKAAAPVDEAVPTSTTRAPKRGRKSKAPSDGTPAKRQKRSKKSKSATPAKRQKRSKKSKSATPSSTRKKGIRKSKTAAGPSARAAVRKGAKKEKAIHKAPPGKMNFKKQLKKIVTLLQVDMSFTTEAIHFLNEFLCLVFNSLTDDSSAVVKRAAAAKGTAASAVTTADVHGAVGRLFPSSMGECAMAEGTKAVMIYQS